jgi:hypothetical protein
MKLKISIALLLIASIFGSFAPTSKAYVDNYGRVFYGKKPSAKNKHIKKPSVKKIVHKAAAKK